MSFLGGGGGGGKGAKAPDAASQAAAIELVCPAGHLLV